MNRRDLWVPHYKPNPGAQIRLFCFPYAGGRAAAFYPWAESLPQAVELIPIELPGHGVRVREQPARRLLPLVEELAGAIQPYLDRPFAFFGHSLGALICYELAHYLYSRQQLCPLYLFVSACRAPQCAKNEAITHTMPDGEFLEKIRFLEGTPPEIFEIPELVELMLPILRADFEMYHTYLYEPKPPLPCPMAVFGGLEDIPMSPEHLEGWREHTAVSFISRMFPGGHFFLHTAEPTVLRMITYTLGQVVPSRGF
ncbi:MAG: alpha/beta fold hydrolase [Chloroflexi bacterium]|nr:alpha/beta fold hydrolase [Chloroflexota bacterium]MCI0645835.1 alpha/beta fold hydrolase [Chloroflexota bacterium]MCI0725690.1 alpha/beta fold hydrolase [Chloroflexota bacterium]